MCIPSRVLEGGKKREKAREKDGEDIRLSRGLRGRKHLCESTRSGQAQQAGHERSGAALLRVCAGRCFLHIFEGAGCDSERRVEQLQVSLRGQSCRDVHLKGVNAMVM